MNTTRWLAYAQLVRLPNVFSALADIGLGLCVTHSLTASAWSSGSAWLWTGLFTASGSLYMSGMVWNDIFDRHEDARSRPYRPLPSRRVSLRTAVLLATFLLIIGMSSGWAVAVGQGTHSLLAWHNSGLMATVLAVLILLYDGVLKATWLGPLLMGGCRLANVLLGLSLLDPQALPDMERVYVASVVGVYIVGVTWLARREESRSARHHLLLAVGVIGLALLLALFLPACLPERLGTFWFPYLLVAFAFYLADPVYQAIRRPEPYLVQAAVTRCLRGLIVLDALLASVFAGLPALLLVLLLLPARWLGKWVYAT